MILILCACGNNAQEVNIVLENEVEETISGAGEADLSLYATGINTGEEDLSGSEETAAGTEITVNGDIEEKCPSVYSNTRNHVTYGE